MKKLLQQLRYEMNRCQSCGMPLSFDPEGAGTEADGSRSRIYCSYCYENGCFKDPDLTLRQMQARVRELLRKRGTPWYIRAYMTHRIATLTRWCRRPGPCPRSTADAMSER